MTLLYVSVQGAFINPDGSVPAGEVSFSPNAPWTADGQYAASATVSGRLNVRGRLVGQDMAPLELIATDTVDQRDAYYTVTLRLDGMLIAGFKVQLASTSTATDGSASVTQGSPNVLLSDLLAAPCLAGRAITGTDIPGGTTVLSSTWLPSTVTPGGGGVQTVVPGAQQLVLSALASGDTPGVTVTGVIRFADLAAAAQ